MSRSTFTFGGSFFGGGSSLWPRFCASAPVETTQLIRAAIKICFNFFITTCGLLMSLFHMSAHGREREETRRLKPLQDGCHARRAATRLAYINIA